MTASSVSHSEHLRLAMAPLHVSLSPMKNEEVGRQGLAIICQEGEVLAELYQWATLPC